MQPNLVNDIMYCNFCVQHFVLHNIAVNVVSGNLSYSMPLQPTTDFFILEG